MGQHGTRAVLHVPYLQNHGAWHLVLQCTALCNSPWVSRTLAPADGTLSLVAALSASLHRALQDLQVIFADDHLNAGKAIIGHAQRQMNELNQVILAG